MAVHKIQGPDGRIHSIEAPADADPGQLVSFLEAQLAAGGPSEAYQSLRPDYGLFEGLGRGVSRGFSRLGPTVTDVIPALGGAALGFEDYAREQLAEAAAKEEELQRINPAEYQSFRDVEGISDVPGFIIETLGEQAANILPSLAGGLGLGAVGARTAATAATKGIVEKELRDAALKQAAGQIARGQATGQLAGAAVGSYALNVPEVFQNIYEETGELAPGAAAAFGTAAAALDSILPAQLARSLTGPMKIGVAEALLARTGMDRGMLRKMAAGVLGGAATEAPTEAAQEAISIAAERFVAENPEAFTEREIERLKESFVRGAVAGGGLSAVGAVPEGVRESAAVAQERAAAPVVEDDLGPPPVDEAAEPVEPIEEVDEEVEAAAPEPAVRAAPAEPAPATPRAQEILRRMGYTEERGGLSQAQAEAVIEENDPDMLDYLDESVPLPEEAAPTAQEVVEPTTTQDELVQEPAPQAESDTLIPAGPTALKAWGRDNLGVGPSANLFKSGAPGFLGGKDLADPGQAAEVRATLEQYAKGRSPSIKAKVDEFLARPEFQAQPEEVVDELQAPDAQEAQPVEAEPQAEAAVAQAAPAQAEPQAEESVAEQQDFDGFLEAERAAVDELISREVQLTQAPVDEEGNRITEDAVEVSDQYRGTNTHNAFMLSRLLSAYNRQKQAAERAEPGKKRAAQAKLKPIAEELQKLKVDTKALDRLSPAQLEQGIAVANRNARNRLRLMQYGEDAQRYALENASNSPKLEGDLLAAVQAGDLKQTISLLLDKTSKRPEVQQILRRIQSLGLKTKVMEAPLGRPGEYDPVTDTITLDPELGLNEHTLIHELSHAALASRIADPKSKEAKAFGEFFQIVKNQLGGTYGGTDVQEFAAELMGNEQFAASLKAIKAPKGDTMLQRIVQAIAEFFGFRKGQSAYDAGIKYINDLLNVPASAEPTLTEKLFMGTPNQAAQATAELLTAAREAPKATLRDAQEMVDRMTKEGGAAHTAFGFLNFQNIHDLFATGNAADKAFAKLVKSLQNPVLQRLGFINTESARISEERAKFPTRDADPELMDRTHDIAFEARAEGIDLLPESKQVLTNARQLKVKKQLTDKLNAMPKEYREMYFTMRRDYDRVYDMIQEALTSYFSNDPKKLAELKQRFSTEVRIAGYVPFTRFGEYQVYYTDPATGKEAMDSFETLAEKDAFLENAGLTPGQYYEKRKEENLSRMGNRVPPGYFVKEVTDALQAGGATPEMIGNIRELYLTMFPASSLAKNFIKARNVAGMSKDMPRVHADFMLRATRQLADLKYGPAINEALNEIESLTRDAANSPTLRAAARNIAEQREFLNNPTYGSLVNFLSTGSYVMNLAGNVSAAAVNASSLAVLSFPILSARYAAGSVLSAMAAAGKIAGGKWGEGKYKKLYDFINAHGQLTHTMHRELVEASRTKTGDSQTLTAKLLHLSSIPFVFMEQYARGTTAIAAYELALNSKDIRGKQMTEEQALEYALETVIRANTAGTAAASPRYMQTGWGRVMLTFKSFNLNGSFIAARGLWEAIRNENADVKRAAIRQSVAMFASAGALGGTMGLPFMGLAATFANIMAGLINMVDEDDDDYFSFEMVMRENLGRLLAYGPVDYFTNAAIGRRTVLTQDLLFRDDPQTIEEQGYAMAAFKQALGPMGAYFMNIESALGNIKEGQYARGAEQLLPSAMRNVVKGWRYMSEGGVLTKDGDVISTDVTGFTVLKQIVGFSPSNLADLYDRRNEAMQFTTQITERKQRLLDVIYAARNSGDLETSREAERKLRELGRRYPGLVNADTVQRSMRAREAALRDSITGLRFPTWAQPEVRRRFFQDEED